MDAIVYFLDLWYTFGVMRKPEKIVDFPEYTVDFWLTGSVSNGWTHHKCSNEVHPLREGVVGTNGDIGQWCPECRFLWIKDKFLDHCREALGGL